MAGLVCEAVIGWGDASIPCDQRVDWGKGHVNRDTTVAGRQCVLLLVKFRTQKGLVCYNKRSPSEQARRTVCLCSPLLEEATSKREGQQESQPNREM